MLIQATVSRCAGCRIHRREAIAMSNKTVAKR